MIFAPVTFQGGEFAGISVSFVEVTPQRRLEQELDRARGGALDSAYEELQSTVEELETTNEELQSTNEELETTNEELQSTNEELETMNEELQSTNEELETINDELRQRTDDLNDLNSFLESILTSLRSARDRRRQRRQGPDLESASGRALGPSGRRGRRRTLDEPGHRSPSRATQPSDSCVLDGRDRGRGRDRPRRCQPARSRHHMPDDHHAAPRRRRPDRRCDSPARHRPATRREMVRRRT